VLPVYWCARLFDCALVWVVVNKQKAKTEIKRAASGQDNEIVINNNVVYQQQAKSSNTNNNNNIDRTTNNKGPTS